ncbi:hypothetical protein M2421_001348 [Stenotrophomonas sp. BIGb0135]|nr:hypothetical protein [Stenotrophomonas sp. BIGb0135]
MLPDASGRLFGLRHGVAGLGVCGKQRFTGVWLARCGWDAESDVSLACGWHGAGGMPGHAVNPAPRPGPAAGGCAFSRMRGGASQAMRLHSWRLAGAIHGARRSRHSTRTVPRQLAGAGLRASAGRPFFGRGSEEQPGMARLYGLVAVWRLCAAGHGPALRVGRGLEAACSRARGPALPVGRGLEAVCSRAWPGSTGWSWFGGCVPPGMARLYRLVVVWRLCAAGHGPALPVGRGLENVCSRAWPGFAGWPWFGGCVQPGMARLCRGISTPLNG